jgi:hypothetical protein
MTTIIRRLRKLEKRFGPPVETEHTRRLRARLEAGRRRLAEAQERGEWCGPVSDYDGENLAGLSVTEILHRGRERVAKLKQEAPAERPETPSTPRAKLDLSKFSTEELELRLAEIRLKRHG